MMEPDMQTRRLPAEWEAQDAIQLTWPHKDSDWCELLVGIELVYEQLVGLLCEAGQVLIAVPPGNIAELKQRFDRLGYPLQRIHLYPVASNDTWARDHGPITVLQDGKPLLLDFQFNGWGGKFAAELDNALTEELAQQNAYAGADIERQQMVLEGGAIESDGRGMLLTTKICLCNPNRNPRMDSAAIERALQQAFGVSKINWLCHGALIGDDTDSHIDTLARLCPDNTILYQACDDEQDEHYKELSLMAQELRQFSDAKGRPCRLLPLPWPEARYDPDDGHRLPATYANFLIFNQLVLVPAYNAPQDAEALKQVSQAFPDHRVIGLDCNMIIRQHGSLHCITMQLPRGVLGSR